MHKGLQRKRDNYLNNLHVLHLKNELVHFEVRCSRVADLWTSLFVNAKIVERQETVYVVIIIGSAKIFNFQCHQSSESF